MCARKDKPKAVTAVAHKLVRLIYAMLTQGEEYSDRRQDHFEERYSQRVLHNLAQKAKAYRYAARSIRQSHLKTREINQLSGVS